MILLFVAIIRQRLDSVCNFFIVFVWGNIHCGLVKGVNFHPKRKRSATTNKNIMLYNNVLNLFLTNNPDSRKVIETTKSSEGIIRFFLATNKSNWAITIPNGLL